MTDELKTEYHGYPIIYNEGTNQFVAFVDGQEAFKNGSLRDLRVKIDDFEKMQAKKDFTRFKVLSGKYGRYPNPDTFIEGEVTSITDDGHYWITSADGRRKDCTILPATESNLEKTAKIVTLRTEIIAKQEEIHKIEVSLERLTKGARPK